eukprot:2323265-Prymnesium_polylepis.1
MHQPVARAVDGVGAGWWLLAAKAERPIELLQRTQRRRLSQLPEELHGGHWQSTGAESSLRVCSGGAGGRKNLLPRHVPARTAAFLGFTGLGT